MAARRPLPTVGMEVCVMHLGAIEEDVVAAVLDDGRTLVVAGVRFTLRALNGRFVREGDPYYGVWLSLSGGPP